MGLDQEVSNVLSQDHFTLLKIIEDPKEFCSCGLNLLVLSYDICKTEKIFNVY